MNNFDLLLSANLDFNVIFIVVSACLLFAGLVLFLTFAKRPKFLTKSNHIVRDKKNASFSTRNRKSHNIFSIMIIPTLLIVLLSTFCISLSPAFSNNLAYADTNGIDSEMELPLDSLISINGKVLAKVGSHDISKITYMFDSNNRGKEDTPYGRTDNEGKPDLYMGSITLYYRGSENSDTKINSYAVVKRDLSGQQIRGNSTVDVSIKGAFCIKVMNAKDENGNNIGLSDERVAFIVQDFSSSWYNASWIDEVNDFLDKNLVTIITALLIGSVLLAIILGIFLAKAESADAIAKAKKRMWGLLVGVVVILVLIVVLRWVLNNFSHVQYTLDEIYKGSDWSPE